MRGRSTRYVRIPGGFAWGFLDQGLSSLTNLGLTLLAGRLLGPAGLGVVAIGFAGYLAALTLQRSLVSEPLVVRSSVLDGDERGEATRHGLTMSILAGVVGAGALVLLGVSLPGALGDGLILFAPWLVPALMQDFWRSVLFREGRGAAAACNDGIWLLAMAVALPLAWEARTEWAVLAGWAAGATAGALMGFAQTRVVPSSLRRAWASWKAEDWPFARWLAGSTAVQAVAGQAVLLAVAAILGAAAVGGLRAAQTVFAPLTLLASAAALPGLPAMSRALEGSSGRARLLAFQISAALAAATLAYLGVVAVLRETILGKLFGSAFVRFESLVVPVGAQQILLASGIGFLLALKASRSGRVLIWNRAVGAAFTVAVATLLAWGSGLNGAAWGLAAGTGVTTALHWSFGLWPAWSRTWLVPTRLRRARSQVEA